MELCNASDNNYKSTQKVRLLFYRYLLWMHKHTVKDSWLSLICYIQLFVGSLCHLFQIVTFRLNHWIKKVPHIHIWTSARILTNFPTGKVLKLLSFLKRAGWIRYNLQQIIHFEATFNKIFQFVTILVSFSTT